MYLVRYESDFAIAQEKGLIPRNGSSNSGQGLVTWDSARLIEHFDRFEDNGRILPI